MDRVREVASSRAYAAYMLTIKQNMQIMDAIKAVGLKSDNAINNLKLHRWRELEWLEAHEWTA